MLFAELPEWIQQVLRDLSREGYVYVGRSGTGLSHAFRKGAAQLSVFHLLSEALSWTVPLRECMKQGTIRAIDSTAQYHDLGYRLLLEQIAILGPKYVAYEKVLELCTESPILRALKEGP